MYQNEKNSFLLFPCNNLTPPPPDKVLINDINQSEIKPYYIFNKSLNNIKLVWKKNIKQAACMFYYCKEITEMNFSHFDTSEITYMVSMFENCTSLYSLDLSNFNTSKVNNFGNMFDGCSSLTSLDLSSFITSSIKYMNSMFNACPLLEYIDLDNSILDPEGCDGVFKGGSENIIVCTKGEKWKEILNGNDLYVNCFINETEYFQFKCYKKKFDQPLYNKHICRKCGNNFHQKYNETYNNFSYINCYKYSNNFYLDNNDLFYKPCYSTCEKCDKEGNETFHNCLKCKFNYQYEYSNNEKYKNCYNISIIKEETSFIMLETQINSTSYNNIETTMETQINSTYYNKFETTIILLNIENKYINDFMNNKTSEEDLTKNIIGDITSGTLNEEMKMITQKNSSYNITINLNNSLHYISSLSQMMERIDISSVNFGDCENILKQKYSFNNTEDLIMYKIEHYIEGFKIPILEYSLFLYKDNETLKLDLDICDDVSIIYYIPILINDDELNQHNPDSDLYNDGCNTYTSESGTDISLYDRKNNFNINNMSLCEKNCIFLRYETNNSRVACECKIKSDLSFFSNDTNYNDLLTKLDNEKGKSNLGIISCNVLGSKENIESNTGFYLLLFILIIFIIIFIIFYCKGYNSLKDKIDEVIHDKFKDEEKKKTKNKKN